MTVIQVNKQIYTAQSIAVAANSSWVNLAYCDSCAIGFAIDFTSGAITTGTLALYGNNDPAKAAANTYQLDILSGLQVVSTLAAAIALNATTGKIDFAALSTDCAFGVHLRGLPLWLQAVYTPLTGTPVGAMNSFLKAVP
jgi:hypothetical protein